MRRKNTIWPVVVGFTLSITIALCSDDARDKHICTTAGCNEAASDILKRIDFNIDPCNNFYEFACGNFIKNTDLPDDKSLVDTLGSLTEKVQDEIMKIISEPIQPEDIPPFVLTKQLYKACMNEEILQQRGLTPVMNNLKKLGGWPVLEKNKWNETEFSWYETLIEVGNLGVSPHIIFSVYFDRDAKNNTYNVLTIGEPKLNLDRQYFIQGLENKLVKAYFKLMTNVAVAMGADEMDAKKELKESLLFEMKLSNLTLSMKERENGKNLYNPTNIKELQKTHPTIPLLNFVNSIFRSMVNITEDETVINSVPRYVEEVEKLLQETPKRTLANYIIWRTVLDTIIYLPSDYRKFTHEYNAVLTGITADPVREKECYGMIKENLNIAIAALYVRKFFRKDSKTEAVDIAQNIKLEFKNMLQTVDWMDNKTKKHALKKIDALHTYVAYPEELMDNTIIDYYKDLEINENMLIESIVNISIFTDKTYIKELRQPINKTHWTKHSDTAEVNAYYAPDNSIQLPAGILQGAFFINNRPKYMNYAGIGFVVGHEVTHGFDDSGRQYDKDGNLVDWWEPATNEAFVKSTQCIIHQGGNYSIGNTTINGENTVGENIADNGGAKFAYHAYKRWTETHGAEPSLPGLSYTPNQMFWISMATTWCSKYRAEYLNDLILTDEHAPAEFRINGVVSNQEEFANDFGCPKGSPMNPDVKCKIW